MLNIYFRKEGTILPEIGLIKYLLKYNIYSKYYKYININKELYKELYFIYKLLPTFFERYPRDASIDEFSIFFFQHYPRLKPEEIDAYQRIFEQASKAEIEESLFESYLDSCSARVRALELAQVALSFSEGRTTDEALKARLEEFDRPSQILAPTTEFITDDLSQLKHEVITKPGLRWRLASLNKALGSLRLGDFGFLFARPETGKTTFLASELTFMATQTDKPILWFNNEEQGNKVKLRCFQAALGIPLETLFSDVKQYQKDYSNVTKNGIKIYDSGTIYKADVERIVEEVQPALIVFDQIDKIKGFAADRNDLVMGAIYQWAREIAKKWAPVIGVCQSDGTGDGVKWLNMSHVADAKTAKQAEADWMLGIGRSYDDELAEVRHFCVSKNKLMGDTDSDPSLRHGKWDVRIEPQIARYTDL